MGANLVGGIHRRRALRRRDHPKKTPRSSIGSALRFKEREEECPRAGHHEPQTRRSATARKAGPRSETPLPAGHRVEERLDRLYSHECFVRCFNRIEHIIGDGSERSNPRTRAPPPPASARIDEEPSVRPLGEGKRRRTPRRASRSSPRWRSPISSRQ